MSKRVRTIIIALVAVVALGGSLAALLLLTDPKNDDTDSSDSSTPAISLLDKSKDKDGKTLEKPVTKVEVVTGGETFVIADNKDGALAVTAYQDLPIHSTNVDVLTSALTSISATRKLDNPQAASEYGFDKPLGKVTATYADGSTYTFEIGMKSEVSDEAYFRAAGSDDIYMVSETFVDTVLSKSTAYIGTNLISAPDIKDDDAEGEAVMRDIQLSGTVREGEPLSVRRVNSSDSDTFSLYTYVTEKPFFRGTGDEAASAAFDTAIALSADEAAFAHPTDKQKKECGFDKPYSVAKMNLAVETSESKTGTTTTTAAGSAGTGEEEKITKYYNVQEHTVTVGKKADGEQYYVMVDDLDVIYLVSASSIPWLDVTYNDVVTTMLFLQDITGIQSIVITENGKETRFNMTHDAEAEDSDDALTVKVGGKQLSTEQFRQFYQVLMGVKRIGKSEKVPSGNPDMVIKINPISSQDQAIEAKLYKTSGSRYTCIMQDGDRYEVAAGTVEAVSKQMANYLAGKAVLVYEG